MKHYEPLFSLKILIKIFYSKKQASVCKGLHKVHALFSPKPRVLILKKKTISKFFHGILSKLKVTTFPLQKSISLSCPSRLHCQSTSAGPSRASQLIFPIPQRFPPPPLFQRHIPVTEKRTAQMGGWRIRFCISSSSLWLWSLVFIIPWNQERTKTADMFWSWHATQFLLNLDSYTVPFQLCGGGEGSLN